MSSSINLAPKWVAHVRQLALRSLSPDGKIIVLLTTKYAVPHQIKPRILELTITRGHLSNFSIVFIFMSCEEKGSSYVISVGQLSIECCSYCGCSCLMQGGTWMVAMGTNQTQHLGVWVVNGTVLTKL